MFGYSFHVIHRIIFSPLFKVTIPECETRDINKCSGGRKTRNDKKITPSFIIDT